MGKPLTCQVQLKIEAKPRFDVRYVTIMSAKQTESGMLKEQHRHFFIVSRQPYKRSDPSVVASGEVHQCMQGIGRKPVICFTLAPSSFAKDNRAWLRFKYWSSHKNEDNKYSTSSIMIMTIPATKHMDHNRKTAWSRKVLIPMWTIQILSTLANIVGYLWFLATYNRFDYTYYYYDAIPKRSVYIRLHFPEKMA
jgi:hypothetical protein